MRTLIFILVILQFSGCEESAQTRAREENPQVSPDLEITDDMLFDMSFDMTLLNDESLPDLYPSSTDSLPSVWESPLLLKTETIDQVLGIDTSPTYDLVITGRTEGNLIEGGHFGAADGFIAYIKDSGELSWVKQFGSEGVDQFLDVVYHPQNFIFAGGFSTGDFASQTNDQFMDGILVALNQEGEVLWQKLLSLGIVNRLYPTVNGVVVVGSYESNGDVAAFIAEYDLQGERLWLQTLNGPSYDVATSVTLLNQTLYISGFTSGSLIEQTSRTDLNMFIAALSSTGELLWIKEYGSEGDDSLVRITHDNQDLIAVGYTSGLFGEQYYGANDVAVLKINTHGDEIWRRQMGTEGSEAAYGLTLSPQGTLILSGRIDEGSWGGIANTQGDAFLLELSANGELLNTHQEQREGRDEWVDLVYTAEMINLAGYHAESRSQPELTHAIVERRSGF